MVVTGNVFVSVPAGTVIAAGTFATAGLVLVSVIVIPPAGAAPFRLIRPVAAVPPTTVTGVMVIALRLGGFTVSVRVLVYPL